MKRGAKNPLPAFTLPRVRVFIKIIENETFLGNWTPEMKSFNCHHDVRLPLVKVSVATFPLFTKHF